MGCTITAGIHEAYTGGESASDPTRGARMRLLCNPPGRGEVFVSPSHFEPKPLAS